MNNNLLGIKNIIIGIRVDSWVFVSEKNMKQICIITIILSTNKLWNWKKVVSLQRNSRFGNGCFEN